MPTLITERDEADLVTVRLSDGAPIALQRWGRPSSKRIVVGHGNGLAVDGFRRFGSAIEQGFEVVAFDMRNHGASGRAPAVDSPWPRYVADIPEIFDHVQAVFGAKPTHGVLHSLSSVSTLLTQTTTPRPWRSLILFEPPLPPVTDRQMLDDFMSLHDDLEKRTLARRRVFEYPRQLALSFGRSPTFRGIHQATLEALAEGSLRRAVGGEAWELICLPEVEARTYDTRLLCDRWHALECIDLPVLVVVGDAERPDMSILVRTGRHVAQSFGFECEPILGGSHLMQLQYPEACAELAMGFAEREGQR